MPNCLKSCESTCKPKETVREESSIQFQEILCSSRGVPFFGIHPVAVIPVPSPTAVVVSGRVYPTSPCSQLGEWQLKQLRLHIVLPSLGPVNHPTCCPAASTNRSGPPRFPNNPARLWRSCFFQTAPAFSLCRSSSRIRFFSCQSSAIRAGITTSASHTSFIVVYVG